jgi:hypothetical protein
MKYFPVIVVFVVTGLSLSVHAQKKGDFDYPDDIADSSKKTFVKDFNQGMVLYKIGCGKCHNKVVDKKELIPDFSLPQLMDYEMRFYPEHGEELPDSRVTDVEMQKIVLFLRYKKKSGLTVRPKAVL